MELPLSGLVRRLPGGREAVLLAEGVLGLPGRVNRILSGLEQLDRIEDLADSLGALSTVELTLVRIADLRDQVERLTDAAEALPELTSHAASLPELTAHAQALTELTTHAASLAELTRNSASLPELAPRVANLEGMVVTIMAHLERLEPTVEQLTQAADDLHRAVGPIGRIAGRLPGSRERPGGPGLPAGR